MRKSSVTTLFLFISLLCLNPSSGNAEETAPEGMVLVPEGEIKIGISKKQLRYVVRNIGGAKKYHQSARPRHKVNLKAFYIDIYELTNKKYAEFLNTVKKHREADKIWINLEGTADENDDKCRIKQEDNVYKIEKGFENHPVIFVSWYGAHAYAKWAGKRLPTEYEWEKAARGEKDYLFPWGNKYKKKLANCVKSGPFKVVEVGKFSSKNKSPYGCYDMAGNVLEWTSSEYLPYPKSKHKDEFYSGADNGLRYVARGGSWFVEDDECVTTKRFRYKPQGSFEDIGFRCVKNGGE